VFPVKILASDEVADVAILRATWPGHPAFALAKSNELQGGDITLVPSKPKNSMSRPPKLRRKRSTSTPTTTIVPDLLTAYQKPVKKKPHNQYTTPY